MSLRHLVAVCLALGLVVLAPAAVADDQQDFELGRSRVENARYEEAVEIFGKLLSRDVPPGTEGDNRREVFHRARPYFAAALIALGHVQKADEVILEQLRSDPFYELPPGQFPTEVSDRFIQVEGAHRAELEELKQKILRKKQRDLEKQEKIRKKREARVRELERLAAEQKIVEKRSRLIALIPFGAGQFQNRNLGLGVFFAVSESVTLAANLVTAGVFLSRRDVFIRGCQGTRDQLTEQPDCDSLGNQLSGLRAANWVTFGSTLALMAAGIIEAQVTFEPEVVTIEKRAIPKPVEAPAPITLEPTAGASDSGFFLGLRGRF